MECHTKIRLRHRKKHHNAHSKVKARSSNGGDTSDNSGASTSSFSLDPSGSLKRSPLKRERSATEDESAMEEEATASKRSKLDLPDSGCDCGTDKMEAEDSSSPPASTAIDQASSDHSSGVFSDDSEGRNKLAESCKR